MRGQEIFSSLRLARVYLATMCRGRVPAAAAVQRTKAYEGRAKRLPLSFFLRLNLNEDEDSLAGLDTYYSFTS